jgi:hypothetical protein
MFKFTPALTCAIATVAISTIATIQPAHAQSPQAKAYRKHYDKVTAFADKHCVMKKKKVQSLTYRICHIEDLVMKVAIDGPEGDNGPTAYFYSGRLLAFRDTGLGEAWMFQNGKLVAEVEVGSATSKITTKFSPAMRREITTRATSSTKQMLQVFGETLLP